MNKYLTNYEEFTEMPIDNLKWKLKDIGISLNQMIEIDERNKLLTDKKDWDQMIFWEEAMMLKLLNWDLTRKQFIQNVTDI